MALQAFVEAAVLPYANGLASQPSRRYRLPGRCRNADEECSKKQGPGMPIAHPAKREFYHEFCRHLSELLSDETDPIANAANMTALLCHRISELNWVGFYFLQSEDELVLGPFQGKPASTRIAMNEGVCGKSVQLGISVLVEDVHAIADQTVYDPDSCCELVVPLLHEASVFGALKLISPVAGRFDADDQAGIEALAAVYVIHSTWDD